MAKTTDNPIPVIGCEGLVLFPVLTDTKETLTTDDENLIDLTNSMVSKVYTPQNVEGKFYASNKVVVAIKQNTGGSLSLVIPSLSEEVRQKILGAKVNEQGVTEMGVDDVSPEFIVAFKTNKAKGVTTLEKYGKVVFGLSAENATTQGENIDFQTAEITGEIVPLIHKKGKFSFFCDSTNEKYAELEKIWATKGTAGLITAVV